MNIPNKIILHCAATPDSRHSKFSIEDVRRWHLERGWDDIGYHYYITRDGAIHKGRKDDVQGAHTKGHNRNSLGVCYEGSYFPTLKQVDGLIILYQRFKDLYLLDQNDWFGHNEFADKDCPGFQIEDFREIMMKVKGNES